MQIAFDADRGSTALQANIDGHDFNSVDKATLTFKGDQEILAAIERLEYLAANLRKLLG